MITVNIHEAKTQLSKLVDRAVKGESFVIAKAGKPLVKVSAVDALQRRNGWAFSRARSPCPTISIAWAKLKSQLFSVAARETPAACGELRCLAPCKGPLRGWAGVSPVLI